ncbi:MAG: crotonase, partial [Gammaproteobacteria bacterium]|nr:crotonase [Gammaproteobacteria bacterium]
MSSQNNYRNWKLETDAEGILWLHLDQADSSTNVLCVDVLEELEAILDDLNTRTLPLGVVFVSDKPNGFIAGA